MRPRLFLLFIMMPFAWSGPSRLEIAGIRHEAACQVAEIVVTDWPKYHENSTYRFSLGATSPNDQFGFTYDQMDYDVRNNRISPKWPKALMRKLPQNYFDEFRHQTESSPIAQCPNLTNVAQSKGHEVGNGPRSLGSYFGSLIIYDKPFVAFSLPYLSDDGRDALFLYGMSGSNDSGHSSVVLYRKSDLGAWEMVDEIVVSIS
jgi:hypothetical protein